MRRLPRSLPSCRVYKYKKLRILTSPVPRAPHLVWLDYHSTAFSFLKTELKRGFRPLRCCCFNTTYAYSALRPNHSSTHPSNSFLCELHTFEVFLSLSPTSTGDENMNIIVEIWKQSLLMLRQCLNSDLTFLTNIDISLDSLAEPSHQLNEIQPTINPLYIMPLSATKTVLVQGNTRYLMEFFTYRKRCTQIYLWPRTSFFLHVIT